MAVYLKKFDNHTQYENYINGSGAILPNVSICTTEGDVHYNSYVEPIETRVVAKFNVGTSKPTIIANGTSGFSSIEIDGIEQQSVITGYTFSTSGDHTVVYTLTDSTIIGDSAFYGCSNLTSVTIPNTVTSIGSNAFRNCVNLTNIVIPNSVTSIGSNAFEYCVKLASVTIGSGVTSIGNSAFGYSYNITNIDIPDSVTSIGNSGFTSCTGLTSCTIGSGVTTIGSFAFNSCSSLTSIDIPSGVTSIGSSAFKGCTSLSSITSNATTAPTISASTFQNVHTGGTLYVPQGSTGYDTWMQNSSYYLGHYSWIKLNIGTDISMIGTFNVTSTSNPTKIINRTNVFSEVEIDGVTQQSVTTGYTFSSTGEHTVKYKLSSPTLLDEEAFADCSRLTNCVISVAVLYIEDSAFEGCSSMSSCTIGENVKSIGNDVFYNCSSLTGITIPDSVESTGLEAFDGCINLTSIAIGSGLRSNLHVLIDCDSLSSITVSSNNSKYDSRNNCNAIIETSTNTLVLGCKNTVIPNTVTSIGSSAFAYCNGLTSIDIPNSVTSISNYAFSNCSGLTSINIPSSVTNIGSGACSGCSSLSSIICDATTAPTISSYTFYDISTGGTLTVPQGSTGYDTWMQNANYYLGKYNWTKVET